MNKMDEWVKAFYNGGVPDSEVACMTDEEMRELVKRTVKGGIAIKACAMQVLREKRDKLRQ